MFPVQCQEFEPRLTDTAKECAAPKLTLVSFHESRRNANDCVGECRREMCQGQKCTNSALGDGISSVKTQFSKLNSCDRFENGGSHDVMNLEQRKFEILEKVCSWAEFDVFELEFVTDGHPLEVLFMYLLEKFNLFASLDLEKDKCRRYCREIEAMYNPRNPYHNRIHAADVLQSVAVILLKGQLHTQFSNIEVLAMLFSATIHDVEHPGLTNGYHVNKQSALAIRYNDKSINENMHVSRAYEVLMQDADHMLRVLSSKDYQILRKLVINTVLATDMEGHNALVEKFSDTFPLQNGFSLSSCSFEERDLLIQMIVHCADISNPLRPWKRCRNWSHRITEEMHLQGDLESSEGRTPGRSFDRQRSCMRSDQFGFLNVIVYPCFLRFASVAPSFIETVLPFFEENKTNWRNEFQKDQSFDSSLGADFDLSLTSSRDLNPHQ